MGYIIIDGLGFAPPPSNQVVVTIFYRLTSDPDVNASYTLVSNTIFVNPDGSFVAGPITISGLLDNTFYTIKVIVNCNGFIFKKNIPTVPGGITTTTSTSTSTTSSTTTTSTTAFVCGSIAGFDGEGFTDTTTGAIVRFGTELDGSIPTAMEILAGNTVTRDVTIDIPINWGPTSPSPVFYWFAIPASHPNALKNTWYQDLLNNGTMLSSDDLFNAATTVMVFGYPYHVYITQYGTQFLNADYTFGKAD